MRFNALWFKTVGLKLLVSHYFVRGAVTLNNNNFQIEFRKGEFS